MAAAVDKRTFFLRMAAPQQKHQPFTLLVEHRNHAVGKGFPAQRGVRMRLPGTHCEHGIEQQHALLGPVLQTAVRRNLETGNVVGQLFVNIHQRGRRRYSGLHRKRQAVRLPGAVVRVLPQNHHFN